MDQRNSNFRADEQIALIIGGLSLILSITQAISVAPADVLQDYLVLINTCVLLLLVWLALKLHESRRK